MSRGPGAAPPEIVKVAVSCELLIFTMLLTLTPAAPETLMANDHYPEWPRLIVERGQRLHAVWFVRTYLYSSSDEPNPLVVWYSTKRVDAPQTSGLVLFTPTPLPPTATPTAQPTAVPTATALPADILHAPAPHAPPAWESTGVAAVALSLLPLLGLLVVIGGGVMWWRRRY